MSSALSHHAPVVPPADADGAGRWPLLDAVDRSWSGVGYTRCLARIDLPDAARLRDALLGLARRRPEIGSWTAVATTGATRARRVEEPREIDATPLSARAQARAAHRSERRDVRGGGGGSGPGRPRRRRRPGRRRP